MRRGDPCGPAAFVAHYAGTAAPSVFHGGGWVPPPAYTARTLQRGPVAWCAARAGTAHRRTPMQRARRTLGGMDATCGVQRGRTCDRQRATDATCGMQHACILWHATYNMRVLVKHASCIVCRCILHVACRALPQVCSGARALPHVPYGDVLHASSPEQLCRQVRAHVPLLTGIHHAAYYSGTMIMHSHAHRARLPKPARVLGIVSPLPRADGPFTIQILAASPALQTP